MRNFLLRCLFFVFSLQICFATETQNSSSHSLPPYYHRVFLDGIPLYYWSPEKCENFGDHISLMLAERITNGRISSFGNDPTIGFRKKLLAIGSILHFANDQDVVWGSGINGKHMDLKDYHFDQLDVRAVRGPLTRQFLIEHFSIDCPEIYGDPALLFPYFFPEFQKSQNPSRNYVIIPHSSEQDLFSSNPNVINPTENWEVVIRAILDSKFVISSSLHGLVIADAYGIPARLLKVTGNEPLFKYEDYYLGTGRPNFQYATSIKQALEMGGEVPYKCDLKQLYQAFPFEFWTDTSFKKLNFP